MITYVLHTILFQIAFILFYDLLHKRDTFFTLNRMYLVGTLLASLLLPLIQIDLLRQVIPQYYMINLPEVILGTSIQQTALLSLSPVVLNREPHTIPWFIVSYMAGGCFFTGFFIYKLIVLRNLRKKATTTTIDGFTLFILKNSNDAFSFNRSIYLGDQLKETQKPQIIAHELVHIKERHTLDLLALELLKIIFWFNPFLYLYHNRLYTLHEYIADAKSVNIVGKKTYYQQLLNTVFETENIQFINQFFNYSLIKKRILMLQKSKSNRILRLKYAVLLPILVSMLMYTSCSSEHYGDPSLNSVDEQSNPKKPMELIKDLRDAIMVTGGLTDEEEKALKVLLIEDGEDLSKHEDIISALEIPFNIIDKVPTTSDCVTATNNKDRKTCVSNAIKTYINANFDVKAVEAYAQNGENRIYVRFKIDNTGTVVDVEARGPAPELEKEAKRVVRSLPKMIPGEHQGKKVGVLYSLPIILNINGNAAIYPKRNENMTC